MTSKAYWVKRELDHAEDIKKYADNKVNILKGLYQQAFDDIEADILRNYSRYAKDKGLTMDEAMALADKADVERFVDKVKRYVEDKDFSPQANSDLKLYNLKIRVSRLKLLELEMYSEIDRLNGRMTKEIESALVSQGIEEYQRQATILGKSLSFTKQSVQSMVNATYSLSDSGSYQFSTNIWNNNETLKGKLRQTLNKVILQGKNPNQFNKEFRDIFDVQPSQAGRLLITETARVQGDIQKDSYKQSGIDMYDIVYEHKACQKCIGAAKGGPYQLKEAEVGINMYPFHPNCLCSIMPVLE
ncbi:minor capsid protein [Leuconostoc pseudomesenteroides]|uniref:minor capsid protein n=1 Tax=Leuconostoc pseudomesenteroides TaxID=33968 RepID=UPI0032DFCACB